MVKVKICGIKTWEEAKSVIDLGVDIIGFVFAKSPRQVKPETAKEIIKKLPPFVTSVGVFVNEPKDRLIEIAYYCQLDILQLHGDETPEYCEGISKRLIKAFRVKDTSYLEAMKLYKNVKGFLLDAYVKGVAGGTAKTFNWELAKTASSSGRPIILAGGLTPKNVGKAIKIVKPYAVDVSSGVETNGYKDPVKIAAFLKAINQWEKEI
ncbi:MAG: phosphoribosylanthranilate isomerase [Clostridia bacterium]|nr:phosphoribosylanthranilate isomerase [Clostridia bacterium]